MVARVVMLVLEKEPGVCLVPWCCDTGQEKEDLKGPESQGTHPVAGCAFPRYTPRVPAIISGL